MTRAAFLRKLGIGALVAPAAVKAVAAIESHKRGKTFSERWWDEHKHLIAEGRTANSRRNPIIASYAYMAFGLFQTLMDMRFGKKRVIKEGFGNESPLWNEIDFTQTFENVSEVLKRRNADLEARDRLSRFLELPSMS